MSRKRLVRLALLALLLLAAVLVGRTPAARALLSTERLRAMMAGAGAAGVALFVLAFAVGELLHVPGLVFIGAAILAYGRVRGGVLALLAAIVSVSLTFWVVRGLGGEALAEIDRPLVRRLLCRLEARPVRTVALLRTFFILAPPINYALALSTVRFRDYVLGSALGLVLPISLAALFFEWLARRWLV